MSRVIPGYDKVFHQLATVNRSIPWHRCKTDVWLSTVAADDRPRLPVARPLSTSPCQAVSTQAHNPYAVIGTRDDAPTLAVDTGTSVSPVRQRSTPSTTALPGRARNKQLVGGACNVRRQGVRVCSGAQMAVAS